MTKPITILALSLAASASAQTLEASFRWHVGAGGNGHFYRLYSSPGVTWNSARTHALSLGGDLASITSSAEGDAVYDTLDIGNTNSVWFQDSFQSDIGPWLGGRRLSSTTWDWSDGDAFGYTDWYPGQPDNTVENRIGYFGRPHTGRTREWNDLWEGVLVRGYVVEIVPTPASGAVLALGALAAARRRR